MKSIHPDYKIGDNISKLRRSCGMTQDQVLAKLHVWGISVSKSRYAKIETDRINVRVRELVALKKIFRCSFDAFFDDMDEILQSEIDAIFNSDA